MFSSRRCLWLFPLAILTLLFAICGWYSWHLSNDDRGAWREGIAFIISRQPAKTRVVSSDLSLNREQPYVAGVLKKNYPQATSSMVPFGTAYQPKWIRAGHTQLINRYSAKLGIVCSNSPDGNESETTVLLVRSPLRFWDSSWHAVKGSDDMGY